MVNCDQGRNVVIDKEGQHLGSQYNDCDLGRSTLGRCFLYIDTHSDQGRSVVVD